MQTFLPYPGFAASARELDDSRLGKQRVETLQILRALVIPDYGWQRHPAVRMWMGYVPALAYYGLAVVDEWLARGRSDSTRGQILEFVSDVGRGPDGPAGRVGPTDQVGPAGRVGPTDQVGPAGRVGPTDPEVRTGDDVETQAADPDTAPAEGAASMPPWLGDPAFHAAHRSNLIRKSPDFYRGRFPDVPDDLPYVWPEPSEVLLPDEPAEPRMWVWRGGIESFSAHISGKETDWLLMRRRRSPKRASPKWQRQVASFTDVVQEGDPVALADAAGIRFRTGVVGPLKAGDGVGQLEAGGFVDPLKADDGGGQLEADEALLRPVQFAGWMERSDVSCPALLQDPRTLFSIPAPRAVLS